MRQFAPVSCAARRFSVVLVEGGEGVIGGLEPQDTADSS